MIIMISNIYEISNILSYVVGYDITNQDITVT